MTRVQRDEQATKVCDVCERTGGLDRGVYDETDPISPVELDDRRKAEVAKMLRCYEIVARDDLYRDLPVRSAEVAKVFSCHETFPQHTHH